MVAAGKGYFGGASVMGNDVALLSLLGYAGIASGTVQEAVPFPQRAGRRIAKPGE